MKEFTVLNSTRQKVTAKITPKNLIEFVVDKKNALADLEPETYEYVPLYQEHPNYQIVRSRIRYTRINYRKIEAIVMDVDPIEYGGKKNKTKYRLAMFCDISGSMNVAAFKHNSSKLKILQAGQVIILIAKYQVKSMKTSILKPQHEVSQNKSLSTGRQTTH